MYGPGDFLLASLRLWRLYDNEETVVESKKPDPETALAAAMMIDHAADLVHEHGKAEGTYQTADGRVCLLGALGRVSAAAGESVSSEVVAWATRALHRQMKIVTGRSTTLSFFNDEHDQETVIATMRDAAYWLKTEAS